MRLSKLLANSVRGIPANWPAIDIAKKGLVVYGPNGVGKSSLVDAIEFALTGSSSLFEANRLGVDWSKAAPHVRDGEPVISLTVEDGGQEYSIADGVGPEPVADWLTLAKQSSFVLRGYMLLRFIVSAPKERYERVEPFLNLRRYAEFENALKNILDNLTTRNRALSTERETQEQTLRRIFQLEAPSPVTTATVLRQLNSVLAPLGIKGCASIESVSQTHLEIASELGGEERTQRLAALGSLKLRAQRLTLLSSLDPLLQNLADAIRARAAVVSEAGRLVVTDFLSSAKAIIQQQRPESCPVCEQPIDFSFVLRRLEQRIAEDDEILQATTLVKTRTDALATALNPVATALKEFMADWSVTMPTPLPASYAAANHLAASMLTKLQAGTETADEVEAVRSELACALSTYDPEIQVIDARMALEGGSERFSKLTTAKSMCDYIFTDWSTYIALATSSQLLSAKADQISTAFNHCVESRKSAVQKILDEVAGIANAYYEKMHPSEGIAGTSLVIRATEAGSVMLNATFDGKPESPLLHFSESHLDTLGLAYFLAFRRREAILSPGFKLLVLDDVLHSVDAQHRSRIAALIHEKFSDHQIVITTHDRYFYDRIRFMLGGGGFKYLSLLQWNIEHGPILGDAATDLDRILDSETRPKRAAEELAAAGGRLSELMFRQLTEKLEVAVLARFERPHDIGTLWPPLAKKLRKRQSFGAINGNLVEELETNAWVRNKLGAHYEETASSVTPNEVQEFAEQLARFYRATHCEKCGIPISQQPNDDWRCDCGALSYPA